jgi:hypothetical protein
LGEEKESKKAKAKEKVLMQEQGVQKKTHPLQ